MYVFDANNFLMEAGCPMVGLRPAAARVDRTGRRCRDDAITLLVVLGGDI